jgi:hypothetical protein
LGDEDRVFDLLLDGRRIRSLRVSDTRRPDGDRRPVPWPRTLTPTAVTTTPRGLAGRPARRLCRGFVPASEDVLARLGDLPARRRELADLRLAPLTDVVTELVLPLHDRDIDPSVLNALPGDTR